jgi:hypothetical protein
MRRVIGFMSRFLSHSVRGTPARGVPHVPASAIRSAARRGSTRAALRANPAGDCRGRREQYRRRGKSRWVVRSFGLPKGHTNWFHGVSKAKASSSSRAAWRGSHSRATPRPGTERTVSGIAQTARSEPRTAITFSHSPTSLATACRGGAWPRSAGLQACPAALPARDGLSVSRVSRRIGCSCQ